MPIRADLSGNTDEHTRLLAGDEEQGDSHSYRAADEGTFQFHSKDSNGTGNGNGHGHDKRHDNVQLPSGQKRSGSGIWKNAATAGARAEHRKEMSEKLKEIDGDAFTEFKVSDEYIKGLKNKKLQAFYKDQNARISAWFEVDAGERDLLTSLLASIPC